MFGLFGKNKRTERQKNQIEEPCVRQELSKFTHKRLRYVVVEHLGQVDVRSQNAECVPIKRYVKCEYCGSELEDKHINCSNCGAQLKRMGV